MVGSSKRLILPTDGLGGGRSPGAIGWSSRERCRPPPRPPDRCVRLASASEECQWPGLVRFEAHYIGLPPFGGSSMVHFCLADLVSRWCTLECNRSEARLPASNASQSGFTFTLAGCRHRRCFIFELATLSAAAMHPTTVSL